MNPLDESLNRLSTDEIRAAVALGAELHREAVERNAGRLASDEMAADLPYLVLAVSKIRAKHERDLRARQRRRTMSSLAVVAAVTAACAVYIPVSRQIANWRSQSTAVAPASASAAPAYVKVVLPMPQIELSAIPFPHQPSLRLLSIGSGDYTRVTFENDRPRPVRLIGVDEAGQRRTLFTLASGASQPVKIEFGLPILLADETGRTFGLDYPPSVESTAKITSTTGTDRDGPLKGYIQSEDPSTFATRAAVDSPRMVSDAAAVSATIHYRMAAKWAGFLNLTTGPVNIYEVDVVSADRLLYVLQPGMMTASAASQMPGGGWKVTDNKNHVLFAFHEPDMDSVAVIEPPKTPAE